MKKAKPKLAPGTIRKIIDVRGGSSLVSEALTAAGPRVARSTVDSWARANRLPPWREKDVLAIPTRTEQGATV